MAKKTKTKKELVLLRDYAFRLYMSGEPQKSIAIKTDVTEASVSKWAKDDCWEQKRKDQNSTSIALVNSLMNAARKISERIVSVLDTGDGIDGIGEVTKLADNISKVLASVKRLSNGTTKDEVIDVIIDLERWLMQRAETDETLTPELITLINGYHRKYVEFIQINEGS